MRLITVMLLLPARMTQVQEPAIAKPMIALIPLLVGTKQMAMTILRPTVVTQFQEIICYGCVNVANGNDNTQENNCNSVPGFGCSNFVEGDGNSQNIDCTLVDDCFNRANGERNIQKMDCTSIGTFGSSNGAFGNENHQEFTCTNIGTVGCFNFANGDVNTQLMDCSNIGELGCANQVFGSDNTQTIDCQNVGEFGCFNSAFAKNNLNQNIKCYSVGDAGCENLSFNSSTLDNTKHVQDVTCIFVSTGCSNIAFLTEIDQDLTCVRSNLCINESFIGSGGNAQSTTCANAGSCLNDGENTNVLANGADCESHDPDTTTYCQPGRTKIIPNP